MMPETVKRYRTLFLSDFHIGAKKFDADALLDFLKKHDCETLYLVGDIIDGWKLKRRWYWTETVNKIFDELVRKAHGGTQIIYVPGNHDEAVRFVPLYRRLRFAKRMGIQIKNKIIHETRAGLKFLVIHGDQFDRKTIDGPVSRLCDRLYDGFMEMTGAYNKHMTITIKGEERPFSFAKFLSAQGQNALNILNNFENVIARMIKEEKADGIICGHTHVPALKTIGRGIIYANCGSWTGKHHTALAEDETGELVLLDWPQSSHALPQLPFVDDIGETPAPALQYRPITEKLIGSIRRTFTEKAREKTPVARPAWNAYPARLASLFLP